MHTKALLHPTAVRNVQVAVQLNSGREYAVRPVRIYYNKTGKLKYISHLDINRVMLRMIRRGKIDVWFTEGFHQHTYV
ncbi:MAG: DUF2344 domain-containing protein, partial [Clostridia bacterium]|nr:DUF2344 domain-containing protein [Clostridia bacterium]